MEHPADSLGVPPLVDDTVLSLFCRAVQRYADSAGRGSEAEAALAALRSRLDDLRHTAELCRLTVLGHPRSFECLKDELHCIAVDYPHGPRPRLHCDGDEDEPVDVSVRLAAAIDLFVGAAFVSKRDPDEREWLVAGLRRAIEAAICFPLAYALEAASYLGEGGDAFSNVHARAVIATATMRLIEGDVRCDPPVPCPVRARLELLTRHWLRANPVTEMFRALTGPRLDNVVVAIDPDDVRVGDRVTLRLRVYCADSPDQPVVDRGRTPVPQTPVVNRDPMPASQPPAVSGDPAGVPQRPAGSQVPASQLAVAGGGPTAVLRRAVAGGGPTAVLRQSVEGPGPAGVPSGTAFVLFSPAQPATIVSSRPHSIDVLVPDGARTGPVALVREPDLRDLEAIVAWYACNFPVDWPASLFGFIPMWKWAYPTAFGPPVVEITQVPTRARVKAFTRAGALASNQTVTVGEPVYIHYVVDPPGSEAKTPLQASASLGELSYPPGPGFLVYTPSEAGDDAVVLAWGSLTSSVIVRVAPNVDGA